jgi:hypothetical protein
MGNKIVMKKSLRTSKASGMVFSEMEMRLYRISGIYNMVGDPDYIDDSVISDFFMNCIDGNPPGAVGLIEKVDNKDFLNRDLRVVSVIIFIDEYSLNMFMLKHGYNVGLTMLN